MAKEFRIDLKGLDQFVRTVERRFGPKPVKKALTGAILEDAEDLIAEAKDEVPVNEGTLRASGFVDLPTVRSEEHTSELQSR